MLNGEYLLPCGRTVRLERLYLDSTYAGVMEGTPELASLFHLVEVPNIPGSN